jgi:phosphoribosyl 1,2-cyclic phosphodiesterase
LGAGARAHRLRTIERWGGPNANRRGFPFDNGRPVGHHTRLVRVFVLGTGSSGNGLVVEAQGERVLVDAGIGPSRAAERMRALGAELVVAKSPLGIFVTHDHGDHSAQAGPLARALRAPLYTHDERLFLRTGRRVEGRTFAPGRPVVVGPFVVEALSLPHDAPQVAFRISAGALRVAFATDLGRPTAALTAFLADSDLVLLEANYCPEMLQAGPYPDRLKRRVQGPLGHLANQQTADVASRLQDTRVSRLVLVHLSETNNTPVRALEVVATRAPRLQVEVLERGRPAGFDVAASRRPRQLELALPAAHLAPLSARG